MAKTETPLRNSSLPGHRCSVAHPRRTAQYQWHEWPRLLLVLLRQRALPPLSRQALSQGLQQASRLSLLESAHRLALPLESLFSSSAGRRLEAMEGPSRLSARRVAIAGFPPADITATGALLRAGADLLFYLDQSGVLHLSRLCATADPDRRRA